MKLAQAEHLMHACMHVRPRKGCKEEVDNTNPQDINRREGSEHLDHLAVEHPNEFSYQG